ncbi:hypothetical protein [Lysobacter sp. CA199]|uniref:hypothetical protein n=1 Tax=Lysobacter sp. CA199 TaxID=3455608 RepID=UPI003F8D70F7
MNENLRYLLHEELEDLFDPPAAQAAGEHGDSDEARPQRITAPIPAAQALRSIHPFEAMADRPRERALLPRWRCPWGGR